MSLFYSYYFNIYHIRMSLTDHFDVKKLALQWSYRVIYELCQVMKSAAMKAWSRVTAKS